MSKQHQKLNPEDWNDRLDRNLEGEQQGNPLADENAEEFSEKYGSQSENHQANGNEDNMKHNQPIPANELPKDGEIKREE